MSKAEGINEALKLAREKLAGVDFNTRAEQLGLTCENGKIEMHVFGSTGVLDTVTLTMNIKDSGKPVKDADLVLVLHFLVCEIPFKPTGELIAYREFTGGQFYLAPFLSRTVKPVVDKYGNDIESIKKCLAKFESTPVDMGDWAVKVRTIAGMDITLIYHLGDEEFPASAEVLFDSSLKRIYGAEDAAVMASRICIGLLF